MNPNDIASRIFNVYKATVHHDDRGNKTSVMGYYTSIIDAKADVKGQSYCGADGYVDNLPIRVIRVNVDGKEMIFPLDSAITVFTENRDVRTAISKALKASAISKLTKEEREALGL